MPISFPAVYPSADNWQLVHNSQTFTSDLNGVTQASSMPGAKWSVSLNFTNLTREKIGLLRGFLAALRGQAGKCNISPFDTALGTVSGAPLVNGASQTGGTLITDGWTPSQTVLKVGDYFSVNSELKLVTSDVVSDVGGNATISFSPDLHRAPTDNLAVVVVNPTCTMRLVNDSQASWQLGLGSVYNVSLNFVEALDV